MLHEDPASNDCFEGKAERRLHVPAAQIVAFARIDSKRRTLHGPFAACELHDLPKTTEIQFKSFSCLAALRIVAAACGHPRASNE